MKVSLIAHTVLAWDSEAEMFFLEEDTGYVARPPEVLDSDELAEFAGRNCYLSNDRPNPATAENVDYLNNILNQKHFSVLEHASATFLVSGISRSLTHELVRHRHFSFSQVSQRYVDSSKFKAVIPPAIEALPAGEREQAISDITSHMNRSVLEYEYLVKTLEDHGATRKQAREAARSVLPNAIETAIVITGNMRAWRELLDKRNNPHADAEIQELATQFLFHLKQIAPNTFQDMESVL